VDWHLGDSRRRDLLRYAQAPRLLLLRRRQVRGAAGGVLGDLVALGEQLPGRGEALLALPRLGQREPGLHVPQPDPDRLAVVLHLLVRPGHAEEGARVGRVLLVDLLVPLEGVVRLVELQVVLRGPQHVLHLPNARLR